MRQKGGLFGAWSRHSVRAIFDGPQALTFLPAVTLGAFWLGGEAALLSVALMLPLVLALVKTTDDTGRPQQNHRQQYDDSSQKEKIEHLLDQVFRNSNNGEQKTAALVIALDDCKALSNMLGHKAFDEILDCVQNRLTGVLRDNDIAARIDNHTFAVALAPARRADLEALIQISARIQSAIAEPISLDATTVYVSCSIGFCLASRAPGKNGKSMLEAAEKALQEARVNGPGAIRSYSRNMQNVRKIPETLVEEISEALENDQIIPWFQPQISTDTGEVTGFEALARWQHPRNGVVLPGDFLPAIEQAGLFERLGELMLYKSLTALKNWDKSEFTVPNVSVNFSGAELRNPGLVEKISWELDRFDLAPERLVIEILETVVADMDDDIITRNITGLAKLGCHIDLDDFGTGHASIANIRRFAVNRIKIDRSFIMKVDTDPEQQRMVSAILTLAEQLNLETLGEGVETVGEHAMLAQLGCGHVQGYSLAKPMPFAETLLWMEKHRGKLDQTLKIGREIR